MNGFKDTEKKFSFYEIVVLISCVASPLHPLFILSTGWILTVELGFPQTSKTCAPFKQTSCLKRAPFLLYIQASHGLPCWLSSKESTCNAGAAGDVGSIPGSRRSPRGGYGNSFSILAWRIPMDRGAWVTKSWTWLKWLSTQCITYLTIQRPYLTNEYSIPISNLPGQFHGQRSLVDYCPQVCSQTWATEHGVASLIFLKLETSILGVISIILFACIVLGQPKY